MGLGVAQVIMNTLTELFAGLSWWDLVIGFVVLLSIILLRLVSILLREAGRFLLRNMIDKMFYRYVSLCFRHLPNNEKREVIDIFVTDYKSEDNLFGKLWMLLSLPIINSQYPPPNPCFKPSKSDSARKSRYKSRRF